MRILNVGFITLLVFQPVCGQAAPSATQASPQSTSTPTRSYPNAKTQANQLVEAILKGDYEIAQQKSARCAAANQNLNYD
jgi:hypothetical protein